MASAETSRRPWSEDDKRRLIGYWDSLGSIFLIALLLDRPEGSVQTEASRLNLPRRSEDKGRHRKKWTEREFTELRDASTACRTEDGRIKIIEVAERVGRSVDAVASRLAEEYENRSQLREMIYVPESALLQKAAAQPAKVGPLGDTRKQPKVRVCLSCTTPFYSEGAHNRICKRCKESDDSDWDYGN